MNLTRKIALLLFVGLSVVFAAFGFTSIWAVGQSTERSLEERLLLAQLAARSIDNFNRQTVGHLTRAASLLGNPGSPEDTEHVLIDTLAALSAREVLLLDSDGKVTGIEPAQDGVLARDLAADDLVARAFRSGEAIISGIEPSYVDGLPVVHYIAPITLPDGVAPRLIIASIDPLQPAFSAFIESIKLGQTGYAQVVDGKGELLSSTQPIEVFGQSDHGARFVALIQDQTAVVRTCHNCHEPLGEGQKRRDVLAFAPLTTASWGVAVRQAEDEALQPARRLRLGMLAVGGASLLFTVAYATTITRRHLRPVRVLTENARRIAGGDLSQPIEIKGRDEIGQLASTFETMRSKIEASHHQLEERARLIEQHNLELSALNAIASAAGESLDLRHSLGATLEKALAATGNTAGAIVITDREGSVGMPAHSGLSPEQAAALLDWQRAHTASDGLQPGELPATGARSQQAFVSVPLHSSGWLILLSGHKPGQAGLLTAIGHQMGMAVDNARLYEELRLKEAQRGQLLESVITAQEEGRKRIARELHDDSAQALSALAMHLEAIEHGLPPGLTTTREALAKDRLLVLRLLEDMRRLIADLRPSALDDLGLVPAIQWYGMTRLEPQGIKLVVESPQANFRLPVHLETSLFRVVQEAINNITKHADCQVATVSLRRQDHAITLVIEDDGKGFNPAATVASPGGRSGVGLIGMKERVALLGGALDIDSHPGRGTRIKVTVPLDGPQEEKK